MNQVENEYNYGTHKDDIVIDAIGQLFELRTIAELWDFE